MMACTLGHAEIVKVLLAAGADVDAKDKHGNTALDYSKTDEISNLLRRHTDVP